MKLAIVEDKKEHVDILQSHIERYCNEYGVQFQIFIFPDGLDFLDAYKNGFDIVFMDINMPHIDGLETAKRLREMDKSTCLIFITEHASYAVNGYEVSAFDFILKPVEYVWFREKLTKAIEFVRAGDRGKLYLKNRDAMRVVKISDIHYIESEGHKVVYHFAREEFETWDALDEVEKKLPEGCFARCGKSYLVNLAAVVSINGNELTLLNGDVLLISRLKKKEFIEKLTQFTMR